MTHERLTNANVARVKDTRRRGKARPQVGLKPAEVHATRRSGPLTPDQFKMLGRLAEQGISPLRHL